MPGWALPDVPLQLPFTLQNKGPAPAAAPRPQQDLHSLPGLATSLAPIPTVSGHLAFLPAAPDQLSSQGEGVIFRRSWAVQPRLGGRERQG